jgi:hypothetical protein
MHIVEKEANRLPFTVEKGDYGVLEYLPAYDTHH